MSALRAAFKPLLLLVVVRATFALVIGVVPSNAVLDRVRQFPSGELALFEREGALLAELGRRSPMASGLGLTVGTLALLSHVICLPVSGALIEDLARGRGALIERLARGIRVTPPLALVSGLSALVLSLVAYLGLSTAASLIDLFPPGTPARAGAAVLLGGLALVPACFGAALADSLRVQVVVGEPSWTARGRAAWVVVARRPFRLALIYGALVLAATAAASAGVGLVAAAVVRPGAPAAWLGGVLALVTLAVLAWIRAVWLGCLVRLSRNDREALRESEGLGYVVDPVASPGSSVGRAGD
ncbi:MAG: hypothetical protein JNL21_13935 [Myxococcales bacterium]|nr:hypothetical protein [Myxococcales bacterium]